MKEKQLSELFRVKFEPYFQIRKEVRADGSQRRIDYILENEKYIFGVELKRDGRKQGSNLVHLIQQANDYSKMTFDGKKIPIMIAPAISNMFAQREKPHPIYHPHHNINSILALFGIGEIRECAYHFNKMEIDVTTRGYGFIYNNKILWHEYKH